MNRFLQLQQIKNKFDGKVPYELIVSLIEALADEVRARHYEGLEISDNSLSLLEEFDAVPEELKVLYYADIVKTFPD